MNGRTLAGVFGVVAVLVVGFAGWSLLREDDSGLGHNKPTHATPSESLSPSPAMLVPTLNPSDLPVARPTPPPVVATRTPAPDGSHPRDPAPERAEKLTSVKRGQGGGLVVAVQGPDGKPLAGAIVEARTSKRSIPARSSNLQGEAALDTIASEEGKITGSVHHVRYPTSVSFTADPGQARVTVKLGEGGTAATGFLVGSIHDAHGGAPSRADISFFDDTGIVSVLPSESFAAWSTNGQFRVEVPAGSFSISASGPGYSESDKAYPTIEVGKESQPVDLKVEAAGTISGRVDLPSDLASQKGPVSIGFDYVCISGTDENPSTTPKHLDLDVGTDGGFKLEGLAPGKYRVRATDGTRVSEWAPPAPTWLAEGGHMDGLVLGLAEDSADKVFGTVKDHLGAPIPGASVSTDKAQKATTDQDGKFVLRGLDPGRHDLAIEAPGCVRRTQTIQVPDPGPATRDGVNAGVISLPRCGSATGLVTRAGQAAPNVPVLAVERAISGAIVPHGPVTTDSTGAWRIDGLNPGAYYLKVGANVSAFDDQGAPKFNVRSGEVVSAPTCEAPSN